jgi:hypothetical protein
LVFQNCSSVLASISKTLVFCIDFLNSSFVCLCLL